MPSTRSLTWMLASSALLAIAACGMAAPRSSSAPPAPAAQSPLERSLVVTVATAVEVDDVARASRAVRLEVARVGGYVADADFAQTQSAHLDVRVPAPRLQEFREALAKVGEVVSESERVEDVTDQRVDLPARLHNAQVQEARLLQLLEERTGTVADVVAVEKELAGVREAIERMDAQKQALEQKIELASVSVGLSHTVGPLWTRPIASIGGAAKGGLEACGQLLVALAMAVVAGAPTLIALALIGAALWRVVRAVARLMRKARAAH